MAYAHILLETYCGYNYNNDKARIPIYCKNGVDNPGYHCFEHDCPFKSYTVCPHEISYTNQFGEVNDGNSYIGFGGEMESINDDELVKDKLLKIWENICKKKIDEAYNEYMKLKGEIDN